MKDVKHLKRKSNHAIFLGCGPSINDLTKSDWDKIKKIDSWAPNNFLIHDFVPNFYHPEVKKHRNGKMFPEIVKLKRKQYQNVNWILDGTRSYLLDYVKPKWFPNIFTYKKVFVTGNGKYKPSGPVRVTNRKSISLILDIMVRQKYDRIYLVGVDMTDSTYFWTNKANSCPFEIPPIMRSCKPDERKPSEKHPTYIMAKFIYQIGKFNGIEMVNLSERSLLKDLIGVGRI